MVLCLNFSVACHWAWMCHFIYSDIQIQGQLQKLKQVLCSMSHNLKASVVSMTIFVSSSAWKF